MYRLGKLAMVDFKMVFRDPSLRIFLIMPALIFAIVLIFLPYAMKNYQAISYYMPIILMGATVQTSTMFGFIYSMVFIHEKDINVARVYSILPFSKIYFIVARLLFPFAISTILTLLLLLWQPFYAFSFLSMVALSILCGLVTPILALLVTVVSKNKMVGMTWYKLANLVIAIPLVAYLVPGYDAYFFIFPTHWIYQVLHGMMEGGPTFFIFCVAYIYTLLVGWFLLQRFKKMPVL